MKINSQWKFFQSSPVRRAVLLGLSVIAISLSMASVEADARGSVVVDGPGFKLEEKKGWFGTSRKTYKDALGNTVTVKKGLFGKETRESNLFGSKATQSGKNITVTGPNGQPLVTKKKTWFHGEQTHVDGNGIYQNVKEIFKETP